MVRIAEIEPISKAESRRGDGLLDDSPFGRDRNGARVAGQCGLAMLPSVGNTGLEVGRKGAVRPAKQARPLHGDL